MGKQRKGDENRSADASDTTDSNSPIRSRWVDSIHSVMRKNDTKRSIKEQNVVEDKFGEQVTRILNQTPEFQGPLHRHAEEEQIRPLLSRRNLKALRQHLSLTSLVRIPIYLMNGLWRLCLSLAKNPRSTLAFFLTILVFMLASLVLVCHKIHVWLIRTAIYCIRSMIALLIDVEDLKAICPSRILWIWTKLVELARAVDNFVLFGRIHAYREWNTSSHLLKGNVNVQSRHEVLWKCPPPSVRLGRRRYLDATRMPFAWSNGTKKHLIGINYCYALLRADHIRRQKKYERMVHEKQAESNARRAAFARAKSQAFDRHTMRERGLILSDQEQSNGALVEENPHLYRRAASTIIETRQEANMRTYTISTGQMGSVEIVGSPITPRHRSHSDTFLDESMQDSDEDDRVDSTSSIGSGYTLDDSSLVASPRRTHTALSREASIRSDESDIDLDWLDVGTRIGIRILNSEHVQKAVASQDTAERIYDISKKVESHIKQTPVDGSAQSKNATSACNSTLTVGDRTAGNTDMNSGELSSIKLGTITPLSKPIHSMWTSPAAVARQKSESSIGSMPDDDDDSHRNGLSLSLMSNSLRLQTPVEARPPLSPQYRRGAARATTLRKDRDSGDGFTDSREFGGRVRYRRDTEQRDEVERIKSPRQILRRSNLQPGVKVVLPILPHQPGVKLNCKIVQGSLFQMATVVKSRRIHLRTPGRRQQSGASYTNCLSVTAKLDKSFLRGGDFAEMTFRVRDEWSEKYMPRHSKFPIGACVATSFGLGVLVGWRVEDDMHIVGSFWQHRGPGAAHAYLNRHAIHGVIEASIGFDVETNIGHGTVVAYTHPGMDFRGGRFFVHLKEGRNKDQVLEFARSNILSCLGAKYIPVIELLREAAKYQLLVDRYNAALRVQNGGEGQLSEEEIFLQTCSKGLEILWTSFLKAVKEDKEFDQGLGDFVTAIIRFLEGLGSDDGNTSIDGDASSVQSKDTARLCREAVDDRDDHSAVASTVSMPSRENTPGFWFANDWFGGIFQDTQSAAPSVAAISEVSTNGTYIDEEEIARSDQYYKHAFAIVRSLMQTVSVARASSADDPNLQLAFSICYEFLLFVKTVLKVQQRNVTPHSLRIWKRALEEIVETLGPIKDRLEKVGMGLAERLEQQGKKAKVRILRFVDIVLSDERLIYSLDREDWETSIDRVEDALVKSKLLEVESRVSIHKTIMFIYNNTKASPSSENSAAHYGKRIARLAATMQWLSSPRRALLNVLRSDAVLEIVERLLVRVFRHDSFASRMLTIHASNFQSLRQLRMLKDFTVAGKLWLPILDAANDELHFVVSNMPEAARDLMILLSRLFTLCVSQFHKLGDGDLTADWLKFLMEDEAVKLIKEIDLKLILAVEAACKEIKNVMVVLPYYPSIDDDILNLIDEVDVDEFLKEAANAIDDPDRLTDFVREKSTIAIERFLDWIPKMSIPVERRELNDGWVLTCRGESGGDLTLSDVIIKRENLCCQVLGGETMFFPMFGKNHDDTESLASGMSQSGAKSVHDPEIIESSILDHIRELLELAQREGYWEAGAGGVEKPPSDRYVAFLLEGMPVTDVINCSIELWRNLEIDDDELLEIVIREVSYQIQWHEKHRRDNTVVTREQIPTSLPKPKARAPSKGSILFSSNRGSRRFNPRIDPTILYFEMKKLTLNLERFHFRIEKLKRLTIFDPVFEGVGTLHVRNISMRMRVECRKERVNKLGDDLTVPILHLQELDVGLEKVKFKVKDTGADWILNQAVKGFEDNITKAVEENLKEQVKDQIRIALEHLNTYFTMNPDLLLGILGISMDDLEENVVWV